MKLTIEVIELGKGFRLDLIKNKETYECWLYHERIGIKSFMFGLPKNQQSYEEFKNLSIDNVPEYIDDYMYDYMEQMV